MAKGPAAAKVKGGTTVATEFDQIINTARERKKNEALADKIFTKPRKNAVPTKLRPGTGGSLASRVGVRKPTRAPLSTRVLKTKGNVNADWTHDLHDSSGASPGAVPGSLLSRITAPGSTSTAAARNARQTANRRTRLASALTKMEASGNGDILTSAAFKKSNGSIAVKKSTTPSNLTIRGLAGPLTVVARNFAVGTTAADIESAMTPVGGEMESCRIIKTQPIIVAEMVFVSREGGEKVIQTFNEKMADGRIIQVYAKLGSANTPAAEQQGPPPSAPTGPRSLRKDDRNQVVDGSMGFPEPQAKRNGTGAELASRGGGNRPLYSDSMVSAPSASGDRRASGPGAARGGGAGGGRSR